jgi:biopolymer transport protein ExbD
MSRHKKYLAADEPDPSLDISSLIDVCFLLLIYFIVATTIQKSEMDLVHNLPTQNTIDPEMPLITPLFLKLDAQGAVYAGTHANQQLLDSDSEQRSLPLLTGLLKLYASSALIGDKLPLVQLWVDGEASQQRVIDVLNALAGEGIHSVAITDLLD